MSSDRFKTIQTGGTGEQHDDGRLTATSATRNADAIIDVLSVYVPETGLALEIASGSGQHIARYAQEFPDITWQPSDVDPDKIKSINSWVQKVDRGNLAKPIHLDATKSGWASEYPTFDLIILVNLLHLISVNETQRLILEASNSLAAGGTMLIYGPFMRGNRFASNGDERFHNLLSAQDPDIGYKSFESIQRMQSDAKLHTNTLHQMPANNLMLSAIKR